MTTIVSAVTVRGVVDGVHVETWLFKATTIPRRQGQFTHAVNWLRKRYPNAKRHAVEEIKAQQPAQSGGVFNLYIRTENDAFQGRANHEVATILRYIADTLESDGDLPGFYQTIFDSNGNDVGRCYALKPEKE